MPTVTASYRGLNCQNGFREFSTAPMRTKMALSRETNSGRQSPRRLLRPNRTDRADAAAGRNGGRGPMNFIRMDPVLAAIDSNGDGIISAEEIRNSSEVIRKLDTNGDGKISREEASVRREDQ